MLRRRLRNRLSAGGFQEHELDLAFLEFGDDFLMILFVVFVMIKLFFGQNTDVESFLGNIDSDVDESF